MAGERFYGYFPAGGYGISFRKDISTYIFFADCNDNNVYDGESLECADCSSGECFEGVQTEKVSEIVMGEGVSIYNFSGDGDTLDITFFPPEPTITITPSEGDTSSITLSSTSNDEKEIIINTIGLIDIE